MNALKSVLLRLGKRPLIAFAALGVLLFGGFSALERQAVQDKHIIVFSDAKLMKINSRYGGGSTTKLAAAIQDEIDAEILFKEGFERLYARGDAVVVERLLRNMQFVAGAEASEESLDAEQLDVLSDMLREAKSLDMLINDPVIRVRTITLTKRELKRGDGAPFNASTQELERHILENSERFLLPSSMSFSQIFVNPRLHGDDIEAVLAHRRSVLNRFVSSSPSVHRLKSDPSMLPEHMVAASDVLIEGQFGKQFLREFSALVRPVASSQQWYGPIQSAYGWHFVWLEETVSSRLPDMEKLYNRAYAELKTETETANLRRKQEILRQQYFVRYKNELLSADEFAQAWVKQYFSEDV